jgi:hypothetical protein
VTPTPAAGGDACVTGYEALRAQVLGLGRTRGAPAGLFILLGQGVAAWMARPSPSPEPPLPTALSPLVDQRHAALVRVLASMALATGKEAHT